MSNHFPVGLGSMESCDQEMRPKHILFLLLGLLGWSGATFARTPNTGLGPFEVRTHYPLTHQFLAVHPESPETLPRGTARLSYGYATANSFYNTQAPSKQITTTEFKRGLTIADFLDENGNTVRGFSLYLDVETQRHTLDWRYGLTNSLELSLRMPFLTFDGGFMDPYIEKVHDMIGVSNSSIGGGWRAYSPRNTYAFYVVKDGAFLYASEETFTHVAGEPSAGLKWSFIKGGELLPAISLKLEYKVGNTDRTGIKQFIRSGGNDWGHYLLFSKGFGSWLAYFGDGTTRIDKNNGLVSSLRHRFIALEHRWSENFSLVYQQMSQTSVFPKTSATLRVQEANVVGVQEQRNFALTIPTSVIAMGAKMRWGTQLHWDVGFIQDYSNFQNETDFVLFTELGWQW